MKITLRKFIISLKYMFLYQNPKVTTQCGSHKNKCCPIALHIPKPLSRQGVSSFTVTNNYSDSIFYQQTNLHINFYLIRCYI